MVLESDSASAFVLLSFLLCLVVFVYCVYCKLKVRNRLEYEKLMFFLFFSRSKITRACDEKEHCNLYASNDVFGNPCPVISSKYIYIKYSCE